MYIYYCKNQFYYEILKLGHKGQMSRSDGRTVESPANIFETTMIDEIWF